MRVRFGIAAVWALLGVSACGMTRAGAPAVERDPEAPPVAAFCGSATSKNPGAPIAAAFDGLRLVALDGTGARRVLHEFAVPADAQTPMGKQILVEPDRITAVVAWSYEDAITGKPVLASGESARFDSSGRLVWRLPGSIMAPADAGAVSTIDGVHRLVRADGTTSDLPLPVANWKGRSFVAHGDWLLARGYVEDDAGGKVFEMGIVNVGDGRFVDLPSAGTARDVRTIAGTYVYLSAGQTWSVVFAQPSGSRSVDLGIEVAEYREPSLTGEPWPVVVWEGKPVFRLDVSAETVVPIDAEALGVTIAASSGYPMPEAIPAGRWVLGTVDGEPVWLADGMTGNVEAITLEHLAPLRRLDAMYCGSASRPSDGLIGLGLRDERLAGFFVGKPGGEWRRVGRPYRDVMEITGYRVADTWVLRSTTGKNTYCPGFRPYAPTVEDASVIVGDAVQIVPPRGVPLVFTYDDELSVYSFELDPTGLCALGTPSGGKPVRVYDLVTGDSVEIDGLSNFEWVQ